MSLKSHYKSQPGTIPQESEVLLPGGVGTGEDSLLPRASMGHMDRGVILCSGPFLKYTEETIFLLGDKVQKVGLSATVLADCQP